jgi:predicted transcriptional regulator
MNRLSLLTKQGLIERRKEIATGQYQFRAKPEIEVRDVDSETLRQRVRDFIASRQKGEVFTINQIAEELGIDQNRASNLLRSEYSKNETMQREMDSRGSFVGYKKIV